MGPGSVKVDDRGGDDAAGVVEAEEQRLAQELVAHLRIEGLADAVSRIGLPGAMKCQGTPVSSLQASIAFEVSSTPWSLTIRPGLPRRAIKAVSSRATRQPEIEVSTTAARHSFVTSSITLRIRNLLPWANWSCTKSTDQRAFGAARLNKRIQQAWSISAEPKLAS